LRKDPAEKAAEEKDAQLRYTPGPTGEVAVILSPAPSRFSKPVKDHVICGSAATALNDRGAYRWVTNLDAQATPGEQLRVWRFAIDGGFAVPAPCRSKATMPGRRSLDGHEASSTRRVPSTRLLRRFARL
jgi:hypothetical protein